MRVILTHDVDDLGHKGDVVDVAAGYARNYLVPRSFAIKATDGALRQAETMRLAREEALAAAKDEAETFAQSLTGTRVVIAANAGDEGKLFGSIGEADIAAALGFDGCAAVDEHFAFAGTQEAADDAKEG